MDIKTKDDDKKQSQHFSEKNRKGKTTKEDTHIHSHHSIQRGKK